MAALSGDVSVMSVADVLIWLGNRERTGTLVLAQDPIVKHISIERGHAVRVSSVSPREELGQFFIDFGHLTPEQVQHAENVRREADMRLGRVLVLGNMVPEDLVRAVVEHQIREAILDTVRWDVGLFEFHAGELPLARPEVTAAIPLVALHKSAAERAPAWEAFHSAFPRLDIQFQIDPNRLALLQGHDPVRDRIVALIDGGATLEGVLQQELLMEFDLYSWIYGLLQAGVIHPLSTRSSIPVDFPVDDESGDSGNIPVRVPSSVPPPPSAILERPVPQPRLPPRSLSPSIPPPGFGSFSGLAGLRRPSLGPPGGWGRTPPAPPMDEARLSNASVVNAVPQLSRPLDEALRLRSSPRERYILKRIDGTRTVSDILQIVPMPDGEAIELMRGLANAGLIRF